MTGIHYLDCMQKEACFGCEACVQACPRIAIRIEADQDGFRYPVIDRSLCVGCNLCRKVCANLAPPDAHEPISAFGGYVVDGKIREESTSGGAFSAIVNSWSDEDTVIFGAESVGLDVVHKWIKGSGELHRFRKSKYLQSKLGTAFSDVCRFLLEGKKVVFSGLPCQIAGLKKYLQNHRTSQDNLLTIEVVCEGVPSPNYIRKFAEWLGGKYGGDVVGIDYRFKDGGRWDFQVMQVSLVNITKGAFKWKRDRWLNPFWSIWLRHLISRPSCHACPFAKKERSSDITLGDLWGVHLYCPELYGGNGGASVVFCNTEKGVVALNKARPLLFGHELNLEDAIRYQGPMRNHIKPNPQRTECLEDLRCLPYEEFVGKWAKPPTLKLLWQKYVWGNRQKVWLWNLTSKDGARKWLK